jgi:hypothetical protein
MKQIFILSVTALMLLVGNIQAQETRLFVHSTDGTSESFALSGIDKITFSEGNMTVLPIDGTGSDFPLWAISQLTFTAKEKEITISPLLATSEFKLYPNPVRDELFVTSDTEIESIAVLNLLGSVVLRANIRSSTTSLSLSSLPKGTYLIQVKRTNAISTQKIIKL